MHDVIWHGLSPSSIWIICLVCSTYLKTPIVFTEEEREGQNEKQRSLWLNENTVQAEYYYVISTVLVKNPKQSTIQSGMKNVNSIPKTSSTLLNKIIQEKPLGQMMDLSHYNTHKYSEICSFANQTFCDLFLPAQGVSLSLYYGEVSFQISLKQCLYSQTAKSDRSKEKHEKVTWSTEPNHI